MLTSEPVNIIIEDEIINDPTASFWLKEQINKSLERDPIDMLNDIDTLTAIIKSRIDNR